MTVSSDTNCAPDVESAYRHQVLRALTGLDPTQLAACRDVLRAVSERRGRVYVVGNGGSASTAEHVACDLGRPGRATPLRVVALSANSATVTALANDIAYDAVFAAQIAHQAEPGDCLLWISCSGNSRNVRAALDTARRAGLVTIGWGGFDAPLRDMCDAYVHVGDHDYGVVETVHLFVLHWLVHELG